MMSDDGGSRSVRPALPKKFGFTTLESHFFDTGEEIDAAASAALPVAHHQIIRQRSVRGWGWAVWPSLVLCAGLMAAVGLRLVP
jgi:hypothetical protein